MSSTGRPLSNGAKNWIHNARQASLLIAEHWLVILNEPLFSMEQKCIVECWPVSLSLAIQWLLLVWRVVQCVRNGFTPTLFLVTRIDCLPKFALRTLSVLEAVNWVDADAEWMVETCSRSIPWVNWSMVPAESALSTRPPSPQWNDSHENSNASVGARLTWHSSVQATVIGPRCWRNRSNNNNKWLAYEPNIILCVYNSSLVWWWSHQLH